MGRSMARGAAATAASRSARPASSNNQNSHYIPQSESGESSDPDEGNAFLKFAAANQETSNSHFSIATYMENEPDVEVSPLFHNHCELSKTKAEQDAEQREKMTKNASLRDLCAGICSRSKSFRWKRWRVAVYCEGIKFRLFFITMVCLNGVIIGIQADWGSHSPEIWETIELAFIILFCIEIFLKMFGFGMYFWADNWNCADFVIIGISVFQMMLPEGGIPGLSALRMVRIFRVARLISFVSRLNLLVHAFIGAMKSVLWVGVLLTLMTYIFAIMARNFFGEAMPQKFGSVPSSMAALFQVLTGDSWASGIVWELNTYLAWTFFCTFIVLGSFGLLNLLTGVFIETLLEISRANNDEEAAKLEQQRLHMITLISAAFQATDVDGGGTLDASEVPHLLHLCKEHREALDYVGLNYTKMERACLIADYSHDDRTTWEKVDPQTEQREMHVHHSKYRPVIDSIMHKAGFTVSEGGIFEGVLEGELVDCLIDMDCPLTKADYFCLRKRLRSVEEANGRLERQMGHLGEGLQEVLRACGSTSKWEPLSAQPARISHIVPMATPKAEDSIVGDGGDGGGSNQDMNKNGLTAVAPKAASPTESEDEKLISVAREMFERYDMDGSGTINSTTELRQFTTNMLFTMKTNAKVTKKLMQTVNEMSGEMNWTFDTVWEWFLLNVNTS